MIGCKLFSYMQVAVAFLALLQVAESRPKFFDTSDFETRSDNEAEPQDAIKYLEELDKFYSQVSRPR